MIFRIFEKRELKNLFEILSAHNRVVGPVESGKDRQGNPFYAFAETSDFRSINLNYSTTKIPAKRYFLPYCEDLSTCAIEGNAWQKTIDYNVDRPLIFFGLQKHSAKARK